MAPYNYNNFYDPVGSQANQQHPQGYTYANANNTPSSAAQYPSQPASSYQTSYGTNSYSNQYGNAAYGTGAQQTQGTSQAQSTSNSARAASALSALTPQDYSPATTNRASNTTPQYDTSTWSGSGNQNYTNNNTAYSQQQQQQPSRSQANPSPLYTTTPASTFGRLSLPDQSQTQSSSNTFGSSQTLPAAAPNASTQSYQNAPSSAASQHRQYMTAYTQQQTTQPPDRYASPLHAVQAQQRQQSHNRQTSRNANPQPSPQLGGRNLQQHQQQQQQQNQRQQSASVEPSPATVDPSQVYDFRAEQERKARIDAERRKKMDAEKAARKAEEDARKKIEDDRKAAEDARIAEAERVQAERKKAEEDAKKAEEEASKQQQARERKNEQRRKAREEKKQSKTAATALQQMASGARTSSASANGGGSNSGEAASMAMMAAMMGDQTQPAANDEEAEMRAMFAKMRQFNARNPDLLAKMWEEERQAATQQTPQPAPPPLPAKSAPGKRGPAGGKSQAARQSGKAAATATPQQPQPYQPFTGVNNAPNTAPIPQVVPPAPPSQPTAAAQGSSTSTALWPPHKKGSLAEAAAKWLASRPENANSGFSISREQVLKILDSNPSYVQLCEMIEKTGVKFERSALAKELLKAVPDGLRNPTSGKPSAAAASPAGGMTAQMNAAAAPKKKGPRAKNLYSVPNQGGRPPSNGGTVSYQSPSFSLSDAARAVNGMPTAPTFPSNSLASALGGGAVQAPMDGPYFDQPINIDDDYQPMDNSTPAPVDIKPEEPPRPPADKEEAARKRTFGDLVDLTADDSDDEGPPRKMLQSQRPGPVPLPSVLLGQGMQRPGQHLTAQNYSQQNGGQYAKPYDQFMRQNGFARPLQKPVHPTGGAAGVLPSQPIRPKGPTQEQLQHERMRGKMLVEPIMRDRVARKSTYDSRTIARDVLLATGRHPEMRSLNAHLNTMQKLLGDHGGVVDGAGNKSDLSTIKWSFIDPGEPAEEAKAKTEAAKARGGEESDATEDADDESEKEKPSRVASAAPPSSAHDSDAQIRGEAPNENFSLPAKKKRGRPKGWRPAFAAKKGDQSADAVTSPKLDVSEVASPTDNTNTSPTKTTRKRRTNSTSTPVRSSPTMSSGGGAVGYAAFREVDASGNVIKKKGRPVGWRKSIHSREAQGLTPAKPGNSGSKLRQSVTVPSPARREYAVYACQWKDCKAELDGLERLKKHVLKLHGTKGKEEGYECLWGERCRLRGKIVDKDGEVRAGEEGAPARFEEIGGWLGHVDRVHLEVLGVRLGDGPRGEAYSDNSDAYLSDAHGRSVTPVIFPRGMSPRGDPSLRGSSGQGTSGPAGNEGSPSSSNATPSDDVYERYGIQPHGKSKEEAEAAAELRKLRMKKEVEGALLGRESSRLCNGKRRRGFLDDEDFEDVV